MARISHITLELAREPGHPHGDRNHGYHLYLPLTEEGRIDAAAWASARNACRVRRFRPEEEERHGRILRGRDGKWRFDYDDRSEFDDEVGFRLNSESFVPGEYVSVLEDDGRMHTFQVIAVRPE
jgi:hypothetical protein